MGDGPIGRLRPFTELTSDGVNALTAATWAWFDVSGVAPRVHFDNGVVIRGVFDVLDGPADSYSPTLWLVPPVLLTLAGALTVGVARRLSPDSPVPPRVGAYIALGYTPVSLIALWLATVPVAPTATGTVEIGNTILDATDVTGVTAGPPPGFGSLTAVAYPVSFGLFGGLLGKLAADISHRN